MVDINWASLLLEPMWMQRLDSLCLKRFGQPGLAEEASTYVLKHLSKNAWEKLAGFAGKSKPQSYANVIASHLIEEFARKRFSRAQPPTWLIEAGPLWLQLWKQICLERDDPQRVVVLMSQPPSPRDPDFIRSIIRSIKARLPWCGSSLREIPAEILNTEDEEDSPHADVTSSRSLEASLDYAQWEVGLNHLHQLLVFLVNPSEFTVKHPELAMNPESFAELKANLTLTPQERLLLKLAFMEGKKKKTEIASALGVPDHQPGRMLKRILLRIQTALIDAGLNPQTLLDLQPSGDAS